MSKALLVTLVAVSLLLAGCSVSRGDDSVEGQLRNNQALLVLLQNQQALDHLYFTYDGESQSVGRPDGGQASGIEQIGEINVLMHNIGASATAGGLYVSGYDPHLIEIRARAGQVPINSKRSTCIDGYTEIAVLDTGRYSVTKYCQINETMGVGGNINNDGSGTDVTISGINLPLGDWIQTITGTADSDNTLWQAAIGLFNQNRVDCGVRDGKFGCQIIFGNPNFDLNRASGGYRLINLLQAELVKCEDNCRPFPPFIASGKVLHGVSDDYPLGDTLYYDYDIFLKRSAWNPLLNDLKQTFQVTACYAYTTTVTPSVCVDPDPSNNRNDACQTGLMTFKEPQGAPIKVSRIEQRSQPGKMTYVIHVEHVGGGQVLSPGSFQECGPYHNGRPDPRRMDVVQLLDARILGQPEQLKCLPADAEGKHLVRLENGKGQITCQYPVREANGVRPTTAYSSAITLEFGYIYQNVVRKDVIIHRT